MDRARILKIVMDAVEATNGGRPAAKRVEVSPTAALFGAPRPLDSLGLVALLMEVEDVFAAEGRSIVLADERAVSQSKSPFRDVPALVDYLEHLINESPA